MRARAWIAGILGLAVATAVPAGAQITITASDVTTTFTLGRISYQYTDTTATSVNIGSPGSTSWDFRNLRIDLATTLTSVAPGSTPHAGDFPGATHAFQTTQSLEGVSLTVYQYFTLGTNLLNPGSKGSGSTPFGAVVYSLTNSPAAIQYALPSTYGTSWNTSYAETYVITLGGFPIIGPTVTNYAENYRVDAYGPMTMKGGTVYQALRIRYESNSPDLSVGYIFISKEGAIVSVSATDTSSTGVVPVDGVEWISPVAVGVASEPVTPTEYALGQNYPNPFNPATTIEFALPQQEFTTLKVFDLLGREVRSLVNGDLAAGRHSVRFDAKDVPSGVYLYRLEAGSFVQVRKLTVLK